MTTPPPSNPGIEPPTSSLSDRRRFLRDAGLVTLATTSLVSVAPTWGADGEKKKYELPALPYAVDALEPYIDAKTMEIHHGKHHAAYVNNLNRALDGTSLGHPDLEHLVANLDAVPEPIRPTVRNNGGGHLNHTFFWQLLKKDAGAPSGALLAAIDTELGGLTKFTEEFTKAALGRFGSGWAWLSVDKNHKLVIESTANQDNPISHGHVPVLGLDVWEHAYYLKYQNRRNDYVAAFFSVINWPYVADRYGAALKK